MQFAETPSTQKMLRVNTLHSSMAGNQLFSSGYFPDVAFEDQTHWTQSVCAEFLNSPGLLPQNHRAQIKGSLKEELNCKESFGCKPVIHPPPAFSLHQAVFFLFHVWPGCSAGACMIRPCMQQHLTHGAWRPFLYTPILRVDSALCLPKDKIPRAGIQTARTKISG